MKQTKIIYFKSPITNIENKIAIFEPVNLQKEVNVLIFFDGQIFQTGKENSNQKDGINLFKHLKNNHLENSLVFLVSSMQESKNKYAIRKRELDFKNNIQNSFLEKALRKVKKYLKDIKVKNIFGFGFSLSGVQILLHAKHFDHVVSISPSKKVQNLKNIPNNASVYYGQKEYFFQSKKRVNKPLNIFQKNHLNINVIKYRKMRHTFSSWDNHFDHILKSSIVPFLHFQKLKMKSLGKFILDGSNISFINGNKHLKIHFNKIASMDKEITFVQNTHYQKDYQILNNTTYVKTYYEGQRKKQLLQKDIKNLAKELKLLHNLPNSKKISKFKYNNHFDQETFVMSHGDLNEKNIIFSKSKCFFIDFEWAMLHSLYWDIASVFYKFGFRKEDKELFLQIYNNQNIDQNKIKQMMKIVKKMEKQFFKENKDYFVTRK